MNTRIWSLLLLLAMLMTGAQGQPEFEPGEEGEDEPTCGLTFATIPTGLTPAEATARVLQMSTPRNRLDLELLDGLVWRYQLTEPYGKVAGWLSLPQPLPRRLQLFSSLALLGAGDFQEAEAQRFRATLNEVRGSYDWKQVLAVLGRLDSDRFDAAAQSAMQGVLTSLGNSDDDYAQHIERLNLEDMLNNDWFRLAAARKIMQETRALPRAARLAATADLYAEINAGFTEYLTPWAAGRLVRETWAQEPAQQLLRDPRPALVAEVADALRGCLQRASSAQVVEDADERLGVRLRLLRALRAIDARLSNDELRFIEKNRGHHIDLLE